MPRPADRSGSYLPALDGVRAVAVAVVVAYHLGVPGMDGGLLGVGVFFTLSGFLITSVLLGTWERTRAVGLGTFYLRRARRLLPAVVLLLGVVLAATAVADPGAVGERGRESLAALLYVANWHTITAEESYFQRFSGPGPLDHLWSLAVEEQFYLVWPLLLLVLTVVLRGNLRAVARATAVLAVVSFLLLAALAAPGFDNTRAYEGTDTRAGGLLVGAAVALVWRPGHVPRLRRGGRLLLDLAAFAGLATIAVLVTSTDEFSSSLYRGGILLLSLGTAALVAAVSHPQSRVARALCLRPLVWVGERSYGIYLWHLPVVAFVPAAFLGAAPLLRGAVLLAGTLVLAGLSWEWVEDPIRRHGLVGTLRGRHVADGPGRTRPALVAGAAAFALLATTALGAAALTDRSTPAASVLDPQGRPPLPPDAAAAAADPPAPAPAAGADAPPTGPPPATPPSGAPTSGAPTSGAPTSGAPTSGAPAPTVTRTGPPRTSCTQLVHVGDSTSIGLMDPEYQPDPRARVDAQYRRIGVTRFTPDIRGARSIVERFEGEPNAREAVVARTRGGYAGCWVLAMGTNEAANQYVGGAVPLDERIDLLMEPIGARPVLWLTVRTLKSSGPYGDQQMQRWNAALVRACARYPTMRVYDWRAEVRDRWYIPDGIHFTTAGYAQRATRLADALATAFPADGPPAPGCLVRSGR